MQNSSFTRINQEINQRDIGFVSMSFTNHFSIMRCVSYGFVNTFMYVSWIRLSMSLNVDLARFISTSNFSIASYLWQMSWNVKVNLVFLKSIFYHMNLVSSYKQPMRYEIHRTTYICKKIKLFTSKTLKFIIDSIYFDWLKMQRNYH